jgi:hypothetical protein
MFVLHALSCHWRAKQAFYPSHLNAWNVTVYIYHEPITQYVNCCLSEVSPLCVVQASSENEHNTILANMTTGIKPFLLFMCRTSSFHGSMKSPTPGCGLLTQVCVQYSTLSINATMDKLETHKLPFHLQNSSYILLHLCKTLGKSQRLLHLIELI